MKRYLWIAALTFLLDAATKLLALQMTAPIPLIPRIVRLRLCTNTGMAFSLLSGHTALLGVVSIVVLAVGYFILRLYRLGSLSRIGAMLVLGGALGNAVDRLFRGYVVDMIELLFVRFAVFNVGDCALCVGFGLLALSILFRPEEWERRVA